MAQWSGIYDAAFTALWQALLDYSTALKDIHFKKMHGFFDTDQPFTCLGVPFIGLRKKNGVLNVLGFECAVWILMFRI